jgi:hypothetical protein
MNPFHVLNARSLKPEELVRFDTGRERHKAAVREAILDGSGNVYLYGSRGSGKTFFQKIQAHYFGQCDADVLPLFIPCDIRWGGRDGDSRDFYLHVLSTLFLEWWQKVYKRPKSELIRLSLLGEHSVLDGARPEQKHFVQLYSIVNASQLDFERRRSSLLGATAVAKAENRWDEAQTLSRKDLLPSEVTAILSDLAELMSKAKIRRVVVHLDEVELIGVNRGNEFYTTCLELFNPIGTQFVVTGTPAVTGDHETLLGSFETTLEMEGLDSVDDLKSMIGKYAPDGICPIDDSAIDILYEFFGGHPRRSLAICAEVTASGGEAHGSATPRAVTRACLDHKRRLDEAKIRLHASRTSDK